MLFGAEATKLLTHRQQQLLLGMMGRLSAVAVHQRSSVVYSTSHSNTHLTYYMYFQQKWKENRKTLTGELIRPSLNTTFLLFGALMPALVLHSRTMLGCQLWCCTRERGLDAKLGAALTDESSTKIDRIDIVFSSPVLTIELRAAGDDIGLAINKIRRLSAQSASSCVISSNTSLIAHRVHKSNRPPRQWNQSVARHGRADDSLATVWLDGATALRTSSGSDDIEQ